MPPTHAGTPSKLCSARKVSFSVTSPQPDRRAGQVTGNPVLPEVRLALQTMSSCLRLHPSRS
jgi:hypothetical protein